MDLNNIHIPELEEFLADLHNKPKPILNGVRKYFSLMISEMYNYNTNKKVHWLVKEFDEIIGFQYESIILKYYHNFNDNESANKFRSYMHNLKKINNL